jgi:hypothetical protein
VGDIRLTGDRRLGDQPRRRGAVDRRGRAHLSHTSSARGCRRARGLVVRRFGVRPSGSCSAASPRPGARSAPGLACSS